MQSRCKKDPLACGCGSCRSVYRYYDRKAVEIVRRACAEIMARRVLMMVYGPINE